MMLRRVINESTRVVVPLKMSRLEKSPVDDLLSVISSKSQLQLCSSRDQVARKETGLLMVEVGELHR